MVWPIDGLQWDRRKKQKKTQRTNVWPELADPLKSVDTWHLLLHQLGHNIFSMDLYDNKGREHSSLYRRQMSSHQLHEVTQLQMQKRES